MQNDTGDRDYYREGAIECIDAIKAALGSDGFIAFLRGQVIKYNWRLMSKGQAHEDTIKANWYLNRLMKELEHDPVAIVERADCTDCTPAGVPQRCHDCGERVGNVHKPDCPTFKRKAAGNPGRGSGG